ncbi:MAG: spore cortex biosynthesis protein YabQ [Clostridia bacterium]|nr:spore cortex biosynthesis protein YabQ [Clostridia bacterium]
MNITIESEITVFGVSIILGVLCGLVFDVFRALRLRIKTGLKTVAFQDILFWIILSALFFGAVYKYNSGQLRFYIFLGALLGLLLYLMTVSRLCILFISLIITGIASVVKLIYKILAYPAHIIVIPLGKINKKTAFLLCKTKKIIKKTKNRLKMY